MSSAYIYLDESGDLGWSLDSPYRAGGSSRFLTIAALVVSPDNRHHPKRAIKKIYQKFKRDSSQEMKWSDMANIERLTFATHAKSLALKLRDIRYLSITVAKQNVQDHIRNDPNKLYNYMIGLLLLDEMVKHDSVTFMPDPRTIKVESGNSLHDYLQTNLWFERKVRTKLTTTPCDSLSSRNVQFADMLSGLTQSHFEDGRSEPWNVLNSHINSKRLFFT